MNYVMTETLKMTSIVYDFEAIAKNMRGDSWFKPTKLQVRVKPDWVFMAIEKEPGDSRPCTCHPDDNPPVPCAEKYAYTECVTDEQERVRSYQREAQQRLRQEQPWLCAGWQTAKKDPWRHQ